ncbi:MAG TPA: glycerate kinase [Anaerolineae bacterium]|nr:glycerate kinase [Anaerolineae bacterium]
MADRDLRAVARRLQQAALAAVEPAEAVYKFVSRIGDQILAADRSYHLREFDRVFLIGAGKATLPMAEAVSEILGERLSGDRLTNGVIITKYQHANRPLPIGIRVHEAGHPVPDQASVDATRDLVLLLQEVTARDLVFCVISGGGSALLTLPAEDITLADLQATTQLLLRAGATIHEINTIRKHLDTVKGGGLARLANGAAIVSLILSDVIGDDLSVIASGPTVPDPSTFAAAWRIVERFDLVDQLPAAVRTRLSRGASGQIADTPKPGDPLFERVQTVIIGSNAQAAQAAEKAAGQLKFNTLLLTTQVQGEAREVAKVAAAIAQEIAVYNRPDPKPACVILGGETTVTLKGHGLGGRPALGGRNQEIALAAAIALEGLPNVLIAAIGTDGTDGPTDAAGAIATGETVERARSIGLDAQVHLANHDAYHFFQPLGDLIMTGPTGTNVNDLLFILVS